MFDTHWASWTHQAIYDALHGADQGRDGFREAGSTWGDLAGRLVAVTDAIGRANTTLDAVWKGAAQEGATNAIQPLSPWVDSAREAAGTVQIAGQQQADRLQGARDAVPPPTYSSWMDAGIQGFLDGTSLTTAALAPLPGGPGVVLGTAGDDVFRALARQEEEAEAARRAMEVYQQGSKPQMAALPKFAGPGGNGVEPSSPGDAPGGGGPGAGDSGGGPGGAGVPGVGGVPDAGGGAGGVPGSPEAGTAPGAGVAPGAGPGAAGAPGTASAPDVDATPLPPSSTTTAGAAPAPTVPGTPGTPGTGGAAAPAPGTGVPGGAGAGGTFLPPVGGVPGAGAGTGAGGRLPPGTATGAGSTTRTGRDGVPGVPGTGGAGRGGGVGGGTGGLPVTRAPGAAIGAGENAGGAGSSAGGRAGGAGGPGGPAGLGEGARAGAGGGAAAAEAAATRAAGAAEGRGGGVPMIPPAGVVGGQGDDGRRGRPDYLTEDDPDAIAGALPATAPPVIGE